MNKYILFYCDFQRETGLLDDLINLEDVEIHNVKRTFQKKFFIKALRRIHLNNIINLPFKYIWYDFNKYKFEDSNEYFLLIVPDAFFIYDYQFFNKLNRKKNIHLIMLTFDSIDASTPICKKIKEFKNKINWDYIFSFDKEECLKYNLEYMDEAYYSMPINIISSVESDIYYLGALKPGRENITLEIFEKLISNNIKTTFDIYRYQNNDINEYSDIINYFDKRKDYSEFLPKIKSTKCILEILQDGQKGQTLRYFEAVVFNKKLLTNNENIKKLKFYNPKYMKVFKEISDIDFSWIKENDVVNYNYHGEFSPTNLLNKIQMKYRKDNNE